MKKKRETLRFELKGTNEDTSNWDESDVEMLEYDIIKFNKFIDKLDAQYKALLDHINNYRYTITLNKKQLIEVIELLEELESKLECCFISYSCISEV